MNSKISSESRKNKGQAETPFILTLAVFISFILFMTSLIVLRYPNFSIISGFDFGLFTGSLIGVAGACAVATGLVCGGALIFFSFANFLIAQNQVIGILIMIPLTVTVAYVVSRLAAGGG